MNVHIDVVIRYGLTVEHDDLPGNWPGMDHESKDEWVRDWIEGREQDHIDNMDTTWDEH